MKNITVAVDDEIYRRARIKVAEANTSVSALIEAWMRFPVQEITASVLQAALAAKERFQISYWDATIIEAARAAGCKEVFSEDLSDGRDYSGVRIVNPFV